MMSPFNYKKTNYRFSVNEDEFVTEITGMAVGDGSKGDCDCSDLPISCYTLTDVPDEV